MKKLAFALSLLLVLSLLPSAVPAQAGTGVVGITLEKIGEFAAPPADEMPEDDRSLWEKTMYVSASGVQYLEDGLYAVAGSGDGVNRFGLFDEEGAQLLPFEAALIKRLNARYLMVYYATEKTTDRQEALLYASDGFWVAQGHPKDDDTMYKGFARFYDTVEKRFVGDLEASDVNTSSGRLLVLRGNGGKNNGVYDENGTLVSDVRMEAGSGFLIQPQKVVYDEELNLRYTSDTQLARFTSEGAYILKALGDGSADGYRCAVIDIDGNIVLPGPFRSVFEETGGVFSTRTADGGYALMRVDNTEIAASAERFTMLSDGYWYGRDENGYLLVGPDGVVATGLAQRPETSLQVYEKQADGETRTLVLGSGEWGIPLGRAHGLCPGLVYNSIPLKDGGSTIVVYNLFNGEIALQGDYDTLTRVGQFLTARRGDVYELYRIHCVYR